MVIIEKRKFKRVNVKWQATITSISDSNVTHNVQVLNIGGGGVCFIYNKELKTGDKFLMHLPFVSVQIYIIWHQNNKYGAMFVNPLGNELEIIANTIYEKMKLPN